MRNIAVGGTYYRVADPGWGDPLDAGHAAVSGQRWNPPGVACLYLNEDMATARSNIVVRRLVMSKHLSSAASRFHAQYGRTSRSPAAQCP